MTNIILSVLKLIQTYTLYIQIYIFLYFRFTQLLIDVSYFKQHLPFILLKPF